MKLRVTTRLLGIAVAAGLFCAGGVLADPVETGEPTRVALMVFVDYEDHARPSLPVSELRLGGAQRLAGWLEGRGQQVLTYPEIEPVMRSWQVRSSLDLPAELLQEFETEYSIDYLLVARLIVYRDRVLLLARGLTPSDGLLCWATTAEVPIPGDFWSEDADAARNWGDLVARAGGMLNPRWPDLVSRAARRPLVLLPLHAIGLGSKSADIATYSLLGSLLRTNRWQIPDPGLVQTVLRAKGHDPELLDEAGRGELSLQFDPIALIASELLPFKTLETGTEPPIADAEAPPDAALVVEARVPLYLQVMVVDCDSGRVHSALATYLRPDDPTRLFGFTRHIPLAGRFEKAADQIVQELKSTGGNL